MTRPPLLVSVTELLRRPGSQREVRRSIPSPGFVVAGSSVPEGADIDVDVVVASTADPGTITASGTVGAPWRGECRRCLEPVEGTLQIDLDEVFSRRIDPSEVDDVWPLEGEEIDLAEVVADAVLLALPLAPLCGPDCQGPDPDDAPVTVEGDGDGTGEEGGEAPRDPRWAALDELRFD
ncbi:YceD family protein [Actinomarinicola tropica]|uniref:YceD family protein n=1 Tax=Actinomarinicola tropica TaxID=2789776 RepID=UPI001898B246|nr:DUF177 domain-containing protein [Actinomarinicola tropica]